jgi:hypothetical protein
MCSLRINELRQHTAETFPGTQMSDHFYVRWTGKVRIPRDGKYTFFTESDDGSRLWIDKLPLSGSFGCQAVLSTAPENKYMEVLRVWS